MRATGGLLEVIGYVLWIVGVLWGFVLCLEIIFKVVGYWGILALILAPITIAAAPIYAVFAWGNWFPLVLVYGGSFVSSAIIVTGGAMRKEQ